MVLLQVTAVRAVQVEKVAALVLFQNPVQGEYRDSLLTLMVGGGAMPEMPHALQLQVIVHRMAPAAAAAAVPALSCH